MWDILLIKITENNRYIVMTQNGDYQCIDKETFERFEKKWKSELRT